MRFHKRLAKVALLFLFLLSLVTTAYAQGASTSDDSGVSLPVIVALAVVLLAVLTRSIGGFGSRRQKRLDSDEDDDDREDDDDGDEDDDDSDDDEDNLHHQYHEEEDEELYMIEQEQIWEDDGYLDEEI